jgi:hypothetical protein
MTGLEMENKIKNLLGSKLEAGEMDFLHGFYTIPGVYRYSIRNSILIAIQGGEYCAWVRSLAEIGPPC